MRLIEWKGWFVYLMSAIASGDADALTTEGCRQCAIGDSNVVTIIANHLENIQETGFARISRKGWRTLDHPDLGMVQWKSGYDFRTTGVYFFLSINGTQILSCWPKAGESRVYPKWEQNHEQSDLLGSLPWRL